MKKYIAPELEISKFETMDIITVSGGGEAVAALTNDGSEAAVPTGYSGRDLKWIQ